MVGKVHRELSIIGEHKVADDIDVIGEWWLPGNTNKKVSGRFTWTAEAGGELQLLGHLRPDEWIEEELQDGSVQRVRHGRVRTPAELSYDIVHGQAEQRAYTLLDCFSTSRRESMNDSLFREAVHVNRVLEANAWFVDLGDIAFDGAWIDLRHLATWLDTSGFDVRHPVFDGSGEEFAIIVARRLPPLETSHDGGTIGFAQSLKGVGDELHLAGVEQDWQFRMAFPEKRTISFLADTASDLQDLISIAVGKTADFERVVFEHPELPARALDGSPIGQAREEVEYRARWSNRSKQVETVSTLNRYFGFDDFGGIEGVRRWLAAVPLFRTELRRVMATRYRSDMYLEDRIMNTCAALDSFDKVRRNTDEYVNFVDRIKESVDFAGEVSGDLLPPDTDAWAAAVKEVRHDLAHHKDRFRNNQAPIDHLLAEQLYWLFVLCMLRVAEVPSEVFDAIRRHRQFRWLAEQVGNAVD